MYLSLKRRFLNILALCAAITLVASCATPVTPHAEPVSHSIPAAQDLPAWRSLHDNLPSQTATSWFATLNSGEASLIRRLAIIDTATVSIDAMYFLWLEDAVGSLRFERILAAAERGVRVRLLIDDSFLAGEDDVILALDEHPNVEVRIYNPFSVRTDTMASRYLENLNDLSRTNHRMHNKLLIGDNIAAVVGGRNIADDYFGFGKERNFRDYDVLATGKVVPQLSAGFDLYWNSGWAFPAPEVEHRYANEADYSRLLKDLRDKASSLDDWQEKKGTTGPDWSDNWSTLAQTLIEGQAEVLLDKPRFDKQSPYQVAARLEDIFTAADDEIIVVSAYLIPTDKLMKEISEQIGRGTKIRFLTNSLASNNHVPAHAAYEDYRKGLVESGVELHELRPDGLDRGLYEVDGYRAETFGLHGKVMIFDEDTVFIGTLNMDPRSMFINTEMGLLIKSETLNKIVRDELLPGFSPRNSWRVQLDNDKRLTWTSFDGTRHKQPAGSMSRRLLDTFIAPLPIDSQM